MHFKRKSTADVCPLTLAYPHSCTGATAIHNAEVETHADQCSIYSFIEGSAKRHAVFESLQERSSDFSGKSTTPKSLSNTRWSCRTEALKAILDNFETMVDTLREISKK